MEALSFLTFFSGGVTEGEDLTAPCLSTAPNTVTADGSTSDSVSLDGVDSSFLASRMSFFILYEGVASCTRCSGEKLLQIAHSISGFSTQGSLPFPLSLQRAHAK